MKIDLFTKFTLGVIAACLSIQTLSQLSIISIAHADASIGYNSLGFIPLNDDGSINVKLNDLSTMDVNIKGINTYDELKVNLSKITTRDELDVNIDEVGGSYVSMGGPIKVEID
ncbi:MAG: hypothetical protein WEC59_07555 [Salibacteraceae bacterium]